MFYKREEDELHQLRLILSGVTLTREVPDSWTWNKTADMTVNSYQHEFISNSFGKCVVPSELLVFSWKLLWGRLSTR